MEYNSELSTDLGIIRIKSKGDLISDIYFADNEDYADNSCLVIELCKAQLSEYFNGTRITFDLPLQIEGTEFRKKVWNELMNIAYGKTVTYLELARSIGDTKAVRAVGLANGKNRLAIVIPCHRVIGTDNKLTGYAGGLWRKQWLLNHEIKHDTNKTTLF